MENSLDYFQWLIAWLTPRQVLLLLFGMAFVFWIFIAYREVKKEEKRQKQEEMRDTPS